MIRFLIVAFLVLCAFGCRDIPPEDDAKEFAAALKPGVASKYASCVRHVGGCEGDSYDCAVIMNDGSTVSVRCAWNDRGCVPLK